METNDPVNHPEHYTSHPSGIECIGMKLPDFGSQDVANVRMTDQGMNPGKLDDHQTAIEANTVALLANTTATLQTPADVQ
jgi:hypothetical protein